VNRQIRNFTVQEYEQRHHAEEIRPNLYYQAPGFGRTQMGVPE